MRIADVISKRFVLLEHAGAGGMGTVFRAEDRETGLPVAVKVLQDQQGEDAERFEREARMLSDLRHPQIVQHIAHGTTAEGYPWLAMQWLSGEDLAKRLQRGPLRADESLAIAIAVARGLGFAHGLAVIHRDIKPSNIFLVDGQTNDIKILDFGIARRGGGTRITRTGTLLGTPGYMAPEQARGETLSTAADVYALGCIVYECLTGEPLFTGEHPVALLVKTLFDETPAVRERLVGLPSAFHDLLERMLSKDVSLRPRDGSEVAEVLSKLSAFPQAPLSLMLPPTEGSKSLTNSEQKSVAVLLLGAGHGEDLAAADALRAEAERHGGHCEVLQGGTLSVVLTGMSSLPTDLAAQAARCALALLRLSPGRTLVLSMGRVDVTGRRAIGQVIDRAARLLRGSPMEAAAGVVVLDDVVAGLLDARFDVQEETGSFVLRGERELAEGTRTLLGKATPCVGRERELRQLERAFEDCVTDSAAQVVIVTAGAGTGKSRLGQEFLRSVRERSEGTSIWNARGDSLRAGSPLGLLSQALRGACHVLEGEPLEIRRDKVRAQVAERVTEKDRRRVTEFLGEMIGTPFPDDDSLPLRAARGDAQLMADQMRTAFVDFAAGTCSQGPLMIVLEDLHWGDRSTGQFVDHALKQLEEKPFFVLALARPEVDDVFPKLWVQRGRQDLRLKELGKKAIDRLAHHVLGNKAGPDMIDRLAKLSDGNAFYLEELLRWAAEGKSGELPQTVVAMVQARLGALDDDSRRLLRAASVFGEVFWSGGVASLLGGAERAGWVNERLRGLLEMELLVKRSESRFAGEVEVAFRHALVREGAYAMLTENDRVLGHKLAGEWLEASGEGDALVLAEHFEQGADTGRAGLHYCHAARVAIAAAEASGAITIARRGLQCSLPDDVRIALLGILCEASYFRIESIQEMIEQAHEVVKVAAPASVPWIQGKLIVAMHALLSGDVHGSFATWRELAEVSPSLANASTLILALAAGVYICNSLGAMQQGSLLVGAMATLAQSFGEQVPAAAFLWHVMVSLWVVTADEAPEEGLRRGEMAAHGADVAGHRVVFYAARLSMGITQWYMGSFDAAEGILVAMGMPDEVVGVGSSLRGFGLTWLYADIGRLADAQTWAMRLIEAGAARGLPVDEGRGRWALAEVLRRKGELAQADTEIQAAIAKMAMACPIELPGAKATLAAIRLAENRFAEAVTAAEEGMSLYATMGACGTFRGAFLRLVHAECLEAAGRHEDARTAIATARERLHVNAAKIQDPSYRASFLENVPENVRTLELSRQWLGDST